MTHYSNKKTVAYNKKNHSFTLSSIHFKRPKNPIPEKFFGYVVNFENGLYQCVSLSIPYHPNSVKIKFNGKTNRIVLPENLEKILELEDKVTTIGNIQEILVWNPQKWEEFRPINRKNFWEAYRKSMMAYKE